MSLDVQRDGAFASRKHELASASRAQSASLLALQAVTTLLTNDTDISSLLACTFDPDNTTALGPDQISWLKTNSLAHGRRFDETSLPLPHIDSFTANRHSTPATIASSADHVATDGTSASREADSASIQTNAFPKDVNAANLGREQTGDASRVTRASSQLHPESKQASDVPLTEISPPEPDEQAQFNATTSELLSRETPKKPAKTVHLPPEKVQEERLQQANAEKSRPTSSDADKLKGAAAAHSRSRSDAASSPSSTVGANSATTPMPAQDSPNTSPDSEAPAVEIPLEFRPTPEEQRAKDEHDRQLAAQKAIAHDAALGDVNTPDDQLKWEEREAAAREAEEQVATGERAGPEPTASANRPETEAEAVVSEKRSDTSDSVANQQRSEGSDIKHAIAAQTDAPIIRPPLARQSTQASSTVQTPVSAKHEDRHTSPATKQKTTSTSVTPTTALLRKDAAATQPATASPTSPSISRTSLLQSLHEMLPDLASLRGAADDPDRDYLESLFRIQAHDSPHIKTSPLPELIKSASKTISTDDHFSSLHERMEYRILRRIYHLQNANKWSLRQMVKCDEPPQPVSQHDHMMAEMKWMCKDFRAERKRKKSVCAWLAQRCAEWVAADKEERKRLQVKIGPALPESDTADDDGVPELDESGNSPPQMDVVPDTPKDSEQLLTRLIVDPELLPSVLDLQRNGALSKALKDLPLWQPDSDLSTVSAQPMTEVSKFVDGKVLPKLDRPARKRGRYEFEDEADSDDHISKRSRLEADLPPEDPHVAIFHADNKSIRDRLHAQNAFRPPSEFQMPTVAFYEFRYGSYWLAEDDHKLRRLAKEYAFNWSAIADQMALPSRYKSGFDRRTPWECFERWVELEQMPAEMRKTVYFKTWYSRLEQSQQAVEKRYQAQLAHVQAQSSQSGITPQQQPLRRRTMPTRVEKRKNQRYIWTVDAMRKNAKKRELAAYKQAEATRAAAQRKASQQAEPQQPRPQTRLTPQQFSQKRYERDVALAKMQQAQREKAIEQQRQTQASRLAAQQGLANGIPPQQRAGMAQVMAQTAQGQMGAQAAINAAQLTPQQRQQLQQMAARGGQFSGPQINGQTVPQAQMQAATTAQQQNMQRMAAQFQAQARNGLTGQQQQQIAAMQNGSAGSPGQNGLSQQQQYANNHALLAAFKAQQQQQASHAQGASQSSPQQQQAMSASPSMGPPPMPANTPQQLSSGHVPAVIKIQNQLRASYPHMTEEQLRVYATERLKSQSAQRTNAMNAAAGLSNANVNGSANNARAYQHNQVNGNQQNGNMMTNGSSNYSPQDGTAQSNNMSGMSGGTQHSYAQMMRQRQMAQMAHMQQSQNTSHNGTNGSPVVAHSSPIMNPASPSMQFSNMASQRPPSRSATPQMQRLGSSGGVPGVAVSGMQSPGASSLQASPRGVQAQANMAR